MWTITVLAVFFFITTCLLGYACYNLMKKMEVYEAWLERFRGEIDNVYARMKILDDREMFSKDDDVGFAFSEILRVIKEFDEEIM